jgi:phosphoribosylanthranilate isomerase
VGTAGIPALSESSSGAYSARICLIFFPKFIVTALPSPRIKICGITLPEDAMVARDLGVDAIGLVFYAASPRAVTLAQAKQIARVAGPFVSVTGLFVNAEASVVEGILQQVPLHVLQFHGEEPAEFCAQFHRPWIKALRMSPDINLEKSLQNYQGASGILFDTYKAGVQGGTGEVFDWGLLVEKSLSTAGNLPVVLAGGLNAGNVTEAIRAVRPYAVDVSGGVESQLGKKDPKMMADFVDAVRCVAKKL